MYIARRGDEHYGKWVVYERRWPWDRRIASFEYYVAWQSDEALEKAKEALEYLKGVK